MSRAVFTSHLGTVYNTGNPNHQSWSSSTSTVFGNSRMPDGTVEPQQAEMTVDVCGVARFVVLDEHDDDNDENCAAKSL